MKNYQYIPFPEEEISNLAQFQIGRTPSPDENDEDMDFGDGPETDDEDDDILEEYDLAHIEK